MFLIKIFHFLSGYVILSVEGNNKEAFITNLIKKGYRFRNIKYSEGRITVVTSISQYEAIKASECCENVKTEKIFISPLSSEVIKRKKTAIIGMLVFLLAVFTGSQFIWSVEYDVDKDCDLDALSSAVNYCGLKTGAFRGALKAPEEMKNIILNRTTDICWCWIYIKGTKAVVRARKSIIPPEIFDENVPCDIIAMRNGIIKRVITKKGRCLVSNNQAVAAGDTIISGIFDFDDTEGYPVHSRGSVEAYTEHTAAKEYKQYYIYKVYTGRARRFLKLKIYGAKIPLYIKSRIPFQNYDIEKRDFDAKIGKDNYIGIGIEYTKVAEYDTVREPISYETAVDFAERELEQEISHELLQPAQLIEKSCEAERLDEETLRVKVTMKFIEEIGTEKQIGEVTVIEPKNNQSDGGN